MNREARIGSQSAESADLKVVIDPTYLVKMAKWPWSPDRSSPAQDPTRGPIESTEEASSISVLDPDLIEEPLEPGDHERYSHYVLKEKIVESAVTGKSLRALCGKKWIPGRDPMKFPICPICKEIHEGIRKRDEGNGSGGSGDSGGSSNE
ncbi:MAG: DUF3039 domain-containing protein [Candidatus Nanopelagicaceae bacterium]